MRFTEATLRGAYLIDLDRSEDERGFFARTFCQEEFRRLGLAFDFVQHAVSFNRLRGTLRGLHFQSGPRSEAKVVRCTRGSIWDAIVDLRPSSPTLNRWFGAELSATNRRMLYVPPGFAHGFQTLEDEAEVHYLISETYDPALAAGVRWDDPLFGIDWPIVPPVLMSQRDRNMPRSKA